MKEWKGQKMTKVDNSIPVTLYLCLWRDVTGVGLYLCALLVTGVPKGALFKPRMNKVSREKFSFSFWSSLF